MIRFREALQTKDFVVAAELPLAANMSGRTVAGNAAILAAAADGIILTDNRFGVTHMSSLAAATILLNADIDPILQLGCRHRNRIAILSDLLGARAVGVNSLYLVQGEKVPDILTPRPKSVMDMQIKELVATAKSINDDEHLENAEPFLIGASALVHKPTSGWEPEELRAKCDSGAEVFFTQLCLDKDILRAYLEMLVGEGIIRRASVIVSVAILTSADHAGWLRENRRRALLPDDVIKRLQQAADAEQEGVEICSELIRDYAEIPGVSGVAITSSVDPNTIVAAIEGTGI